MHAPFRKAIEDDPELKHAVIVHDPFHIMKRANEALSELRRVTFFRAGPELRAVGRGTSWLVLKAWEKTSDEEKATLCQLFSCNTKLARAYQVVDELRTVHRRDESRPSTTIGKPWCVAPEAIEITNICWPNSASSPQTQLPTTRAFGASSRSA